MHFLNKMERKFGKFAIQGLMKYIILFYVAGYLINILAPQAYGFSDAGAVYDFPLRTGLATGVLGIDSTTNRKYYFYADHGCALLSAWYCAGAHLGRISI